MGYIYFIGRNRRVCDGLDMEYEGSSGIKAVFMVLPLERLGEVLVSFSYLRSC